jgi:hypothetical protein
MGHGALGIPHFLENCYMLPQELTIAYQHRQQGNSGHGTVPFSYPNIIDRAIGCHDKTAIENTAPCRFPTSKLSSPSEDVIITRFFGKRHCGVLISGNRYSSGRTGAQKPGFFRKKLGCDPADSVKNPVSWVGVRLGLG